MAKAFHIHVWKRAPFIRLALPLIIGIICQFYLQLFIAQIIWLTVIFILAFLAFNALPQYLRFHYKFVQGIIISLFMMVLGFFVTWQRDVRNNSGWYGNHYGDSSFMMVTIDEPLVEKAKSFKALVSADFVITNATTQKVCGKMVLYLGKESGSETLQYGDKILFKKRIEPIRNSGNPGAFDYAQYSAFRQLYHQCFLRKNEYVLLKEKNKSAWSSFLFATRKRVVNIIDEYVTGVDEAAIAKALLIGYKVDLDRDLVQAYSNAGVVHLIAISGLHMGIIYGVLLWVFSTIPVLKNLKFIRLFLILVFLWLFAFLTGAAPSVMRAAVMFSFILAGGAFNKSGSVYNSLAGSAFFLLCFNPYILWDVGFQLSYLAVLGIVIGQKFISKWFYFQNKILQYAWQLAAVSLAAQLFTFPVCLYYFHQLPMLFLLANIIAIPLATLILWSCLLLVLISPIEFAAFYFGKFINALLWLLNKTVVTVNSIPFSLWEGFSISVLETCFLYVIACCIAHAFMIKSKLTFKLAIYCSLILATSTFFEKWNTSHQQKMVVYNVPGFKAIDFITGENFTFAGDAQLGANKGLETFQLKPTRIYFMANSPLLSGKSFYQSRNFFTLNNKRIQVIDSAIHYAIHTEKIKRDYIIISKNPAVSIKDLAKKFECNHYISDATNSLWKIEKWKKECEELHLQFHSVVEQGAFVTDL